MIDLAVIPVAGRGTRLLPLTKSQPKEMLPVAGKPVVQYVVEELIRSGVHRMLFVTGAGKTAIENHFDIDNELIDNLRATGKEDLLAELAFEREDADYFYLRQRRQLGLGHAVLCAEPFIRGQRFVVALGDSIIGRGSESKIIKRMIDLFEKHDDVKGIIAFEEVPHDEVFQYGIAQPGKSASDFFELDDIVEKPSPEEAPSQLAVAARYVFSAEIFEYLRTTTPGKGGEIQLTDAIRRMIHNKKRFLGVHLSPSEKRYDVGNFESYFAAFTEFALADPVYGAAVKQHLKKLLERM
ncbi:MAG: UTP--glucose-1-phosphate uridylyltransferase [Planctomycetaceae bacterium]|jgi:UTP--glucose-1-phosphate uridylyltransferase|nr:UTP--glucose-1-phosphate uridylyltransferase [Planctomycetaceae bacterium]